MDAAERELYTQSVRAAVAAAQSSDLDATLSALGWHDALGADRRSAVAAVFEACGELGGRGPLDDVLGAELRPQQATDGVAVLLPELGQADPPAARHGDQLVVRGLVRAEVARTGTVLVTARHPGGVELHAVATTDLDVGPALALEPSLGWAEVAGMASAGSPLVADAAGDWERAVALGRLALAHELVGAGRRLLELARVHALDRVQFGRPIAGFQAVRHRLADGLVATEAAAAAVDAAWDLATPEAAGSAKAVAGATARQVGRHAQQVLAGMGFTAEHPLPAVVKRTLVLDQELGSAATLTREIGAELVAGRALPQPLPL